MSYSTSDLLTEFAHVLMQILPPEIGKSFRYESRGGKFLFFLEFLSEDAQFQSPEVRRNFSCLLEGLQAVTQIQKNKNGKTIAVYSFDINPAFIDSMGKNIEWWGLMHPIRALKTAWNYSNEIKGI